MPASATVCNVFYTYVIRKTTRNVFVFLCIAQVVNLSLVSGEIQADRCFKWKDHRYKMDYLPITMECDPGLMDTPLLSGHGCFGARIPQRQSCVITLLPSIVAIPLRHGASRWRMHFHMDCF
jgi:hypothetical protein